jgi:hypothetical protein
MEKDRQLAGILKSSLKNKMAISCWTCIKLESLQRQLKLDEKQNGGLL